jgi:septal ring factor EnvC (AmiA/AmiB activator)
MLICIHDPDESKIMRNITQSIDFLEVEEWLSQVKKIKNSHSLAYTSIKVREILCSYVASEKIYFLLKLFIFVMQGLMLSKSLRIQQEKEDDELSKLQDETGSLQNSLHEKESEVASLKEKLAEANEVKKQAKTKIKE